MLALRHAARSSLQRTVIPSASQASVVLGGGCARSTTSKRTFHCDGVAFPNSCYAATPSVPVLTSTAILPVDNSTSMVHPEPASSMSLAERLLEVLEEGAIWMVSTLKRRNRKMNKHKLRKRRKKNRKKTRKI